MTEKFVERLKMASIKQQMSELVKIRPHHIKKFSIELKENGIEIVIETYEKTFRVNTRNKNLSFVYEKMSVLFLDYSNPMMELIEKDARLLEHLEGEEASHPQDLMEF
jgi:hypothetical protein